MLNRAVLVRAPACLALILSGCTYASTSTTPVEIPGVGLAYRYEGRANFPHQIAEADRAMAAHCASVNGGRPVIVSLAKRNIGFGGLSNTSGYGTMSGNVMGVPGGATMTGTASGTAMTTGSIMANQNQEILFRCAK